MDSECDEKARLLGKQALDQPIPKYSPPVRRWTLCSILKIIAIGCIVFIGTIGWRAIPSMFQKSKHNADLESDPWWHEHCHLLEFSRNEESKFEKLEKFAFSETIMPRDGDSANCDTHSRAHSASSRYHSYIKLLPAEDDQKVDIHAAVSINASWDFTSAYAATDSSLSVTLPNLWTREPERRWLCAAVVLYVRKGLELKDLSLAANVTQLWVKNVDLSTTNTNIRLDVGSLGAYPFFKSRETHIVVGAGSVSGEFDLYDLLDVNTATGSINADVIPKPADKDKPLPARLQAASHSGSVHVKYPPEGTDIPEREYETIVTTHQGQVTGNYLHGKNTTFETQQGSINTSILPYRADGGNTTLSVTTRMGQQTIEVLSPYLNPGTPMKNLSSSHITTTSSMNLKYPAEWEGSLDGETRIGSLTLKASDLKDIDQGKLGLLGRYVRASKGDGDSQLLFRTDVGSTHVVIGDE